ncbi:DNA repair protein rad9 [Nesidiocoris tenuis]|uniref:DNA repair protein rad9 n=1 Tax=Nesidiocoris tenuis TaxID=355587 RepID=A0ABN7B6A7_9HEMI|nr:DNA repair protein rad9 [Nesidiocoris tenuis]
MKCLIPSNHVKVIARAVHSLAKIGDDIFIDCSEDGLLFCTVNLAESAFGEFRFLRSFFSAYSFVPAEESDSGVKVTMKSLLSVFKNPHYMDKQVESCEIKIKPTGTVVVLLIKYSHGYMKKYYLPVIANERLNANVPTDAANCLSASSKFLSTAMRNFRHSEDEITLTALSDRILIKNHVELRKNEIIMRTELCFPPTEFSNYSVAEPNTVTFGYKELKAVLAFAEPSGLQIAISFSSPGHPIVFKVENHPAYEANYVVATLNSTNNSSIDSSRVGSQRTPARSQVRQPLGNGSNQSHRSEEPIESVGVDSPDPIVGAPSRLLGSRVDLAKKTPSRELEHDVEMSSDDVAKMGPPHLPMDGVIPDSDVSATSVSQDAAAGRINESPVVQGSVQSAYASSSGMFNNASPLSLASHDLPQITSSVNFAHGAGARSASASHAEETYEPSAQRLLRVVFARCYPGSKHILDRSPQHRIILADNSDDEDANGLEVKRKREL